MASAMKPSNRTTPPGTGSRICGSGALLGGALLGGALLGGALLGGALLGCVREPAERLCPEVRAGALVVSELRAAPAGSAGEASWIELFNASEHELDLEGLGVRLVRLDGGAEQRALVRRALPLAAGAALVLGQTRDDDRPAYAAYGFALDVPGPFYAAGAVAVESCEVLVDRMTYAKLPADASHALGAWPPAADGNDEAAAWCPDAGRDGSASALSPGTPGEGNPPCR
jgi:hypothetical protein